MTALRYVPLAIRVLAFVATGTWVFAEGDVTVVPTSSSAPAPTQQPTDSDGTPVVHKSSHKKKKAPVTNAPAATAPAASAPATTATATTVSHATAPAPTITVTAPAHSPATVTPTPTHTPTTITVTPMPAHTPATVTVAPVPVTPVKPPPAIAPTNIAVVKGIPIMAPPTTVIVPTAGNLNTSPSIETGLPVAHYPGMGSAIVGVSTYIPPKPAVVPTTKPPTGETTHQPYFASALPASVFSVTPVAAGTFSTPKPSRTTTSGSPDIVFANLNKKTKLQYPWKVGIITTVFWIGEGGSNISSTDNIGSAWDEHWRTTNHGTDTPNDRNGFAPADHAATVNTFYVALPFNDLAFPDKAHDWVPRSWRRPNQDGKQVSACKDRWVCIKSSNGHMCFAQWEDVGPLRYDHAEYVFGSERPNTYTRAGLDVSPAVAQYLGLDSSKRAITSWRFVDEEDVPPGQWLKYDEQAVLFAAMHQLKNAPPRVDAPIQKATEPSQDPDSVNSNKKKVGASKG